MEALPRRPDPVLHPASGLRCTADESNAISVLQALAKKHQAALFVKSTISQDLTDLDAFQRDRFCALATEKGHRKSPKGYEGANNAQTERENMVASPDEDEGGDAHSEASSEPAGPALMGPVRRKRRRKSLFVGGGPLMVGVGGEPFMVGGGGPPPGADGGATGGFDSSSFSDNIRSVTDGTRTFHFNMGGDGPRGGGFSFADPNDIFDEFLKGGADGIGDGIGGARMDDDFFSAFIGGARPSSGGGRKSSRFSRAPRA